MMGYHQLFIPFEGLFALLGGYFSYLYQIKSTIAIAVAAYIIIHKLYIAFFGPLSKIPGPFYTRFFKLPRILLETPKGTSFQKLKHLHEIYGDIVRLGPSVISVANKEMAKQILVTEDLPKGPLYKAFQRENESNLFNATDKHWHKNRRRIISPAFSIKFISSLEPFMLECTKKFINQINKDIDVTKGDDEYGIVDIWNLLHRLTLDVIGETAFGSSFDLVENNSRIIPHAISKYLHYGAVRALLPYLSRIILLNAEYGKPTIIQFLQDIIDKRLKNKSEERKDILQYLINSQKSQNKDDRLTSDAIIEETILFLIGGSETSSNTIGFGFYELLRCPDKLAKLYQEIDAISLNENGLFFHDQLKNLPYLNAVINETLRLDPVSASSLSRITSKPMILGEMVLPENTDVFVNTYHLQTNEKYFPQPLEFIPERWLEEMDSNDLEASIPFSLGSRNCIGKNFALQEIRLSFAAALKHFDIQAIDSEMEDAKVRRQFITQTIAKGSFKIKIKQRK